MKIQTTNVFGIFLIIVVVFALITLFPLMVIWSLNTLFGFTIAYSFKTWVAVLILISAIRGYSSSSK